MILRSVGIAGAIVVGLAVAAALTLLPAHPVASSAPRLDRLAVRRVAVDGRRPTARGRGWPDGSWTTRSPCWSRRCCSCCSSARRSCTSASTRRTPRSCRRPCPRAPPSTASSASSARASSRRSSLAIRTDRPGDDPGEPRRAVRLLAPARRRPADHPRRQPRGRRPAADARAVPAAVRRPGGPRDRYIADRAGGDDAGRPDGVHRSTRRTARTATRAGRSSTTCATRARRSRRRPG